MSISKSQAAALAEGFLETQGSDDKSSLRPKETFTELILLAGEFIEDAQSNLNHSNSNASGKLSESLTIGEPTHQNGVVEADILMNFYGQFINKGVKGTRSGASTAGYSFKTDMPGRAMVAAIEKYISRAKKSTSSVKKYKGYGAHETKNKTISQHDHAFAVARSIKMHGIKATGFLDKAILTTSAKIQERLESAFVTDIINSI